MEVQLVWPFRCRVPRVGSEGVNRGTRIGSARVRRKAVTAMRAVVQRVASASVEVEGRIVSEIGPGLLVLVGIHDTDSDADADYMSCSFLRPLSFQFQISVTQISLLF